MTRQCSDCGKAFEPRGDWAKLCVPCWRERKDREVYAQGYDQGYQAGVWDGTASSGPPALPPELVRDLILLCHPDRHPPERSTLANRTTAVLLDAAKSHPKENR